MIQITLNYDKTLSDRMNFAALLNSNFGTTLTEDDVKDVKATSIDGDYNTEVTIDLPEVGEQVIQYNRVDIETLVDTDTLIGVDNPALLRNALKTQFSIVTGPRDLGIDASKRADGILGVTMAGTLCITGKVHFRLHPSLSTALNKSVGKIQIVPTGFCKRLTADINTLPYIAGVKLSGDMPALFADPRDGEVLLTDTFDGPALEFNNLSTTIELGIDKFGFDTITSNFVFQTIVSYDETVAGLGKFQLNIGCSVITFEFTNEHMLIGNASYPIIPDNLLAIKCIGQAGSDTLSFYINDKLLSKSLIGALPKSVGGDLSFSSIGLSGFRLHEFGIKQY